MFKMMCEKMIFDSQFCPGTHTKVKHVLSQLPKRFYFSTDLSKYLRSKAAVKHILATARMPTNRDIAGCVRVLASFLVGHMSALSKRLFMLR